MPNKTIYVAEGDLEVFEEAQKRAGSNLSATIAAALKQFIKTSEAKQEGFQEITIKLGEDGTYSYKRFLGRELGRSQTIDDDRETAHVYIVYKTVKQNYALYTKEIHRSIHELMRLETERKLAEKYNLERESDEEALWIQPNRYTLDVYHTFEELKEHLPVKLFNTLSRQQGQSDDDFLDI
ncbi:EXLDI family protein [Pullulanibacillus pueri]|uniref:EXLDI protein n=1 Tax=Pullulanibacillus pueri TaxID=1437324 RepID=A0A8J3ENH6_9BACL|nr:EXLDI protein [Pullulanibacillus pueri]MBM7683589.1 EXLDI family protein [Pullulanibacillus pueri]GGH84524.1 hypothetical protein GCM10007096_27800 [Pullulanibacillus pueri]